MPKIVISFPFFLCLLFAAPATAQNRVGNEELLAEVRRLSQIVEHSLATSLRLQLVLAKLQVQDRRTAAANLRLDNAKNKLTDVDAQVDSVEDRLQRYQEGVNAAVDAKQRETFVVLLREGQAQRQRLEADRATAQNEVSDAEGRFAAEQSALTDLSRQLDAIERTLGASVKQE